MVVCNDSVYYSSVILVSAASLAITSPQNKVRGSLSNTYIFLVFTNNSYYISIKFEEMDVKVMHFFLVAYAIFFLQESSKTYGYSCDYNECNCVEEMITCIDIAAPRFKFRPTVTKLYMENVRIVDIKKHNLPNLKYVTLVNIKYFNCRFLENFASNALVRTNMCDSEKESLFTRISTIESQTDASIPFSKVNEMEISQYKSLEDLTTKYVNTYHNHKEGKVTEYISLESDSSYHYDQKITVNSLEELSTTSEAGFYNLPSKVLNPVIFHM